MQNESANINFNEEIGKIFGVDYIEILPKNELKFKVNAVVMHPTIITNFYKLFNSFIDEMERAKNETPALNIFKQNLIHSKKQFDVSMEKIRANIAGAFKNNAEVSLEYKGEIKEIYEKVSELIK